MSQDYAWPAAWRDDHASRAQAERRAAAAQDEAFAPRVLAGIPQAFDLCVFAVLALAVFPRLCFPGLAPAAGAAAALGIWALPYLAARPTRAGFARFATHLDPRLRLAGARAFFVGASLVLAALPSAGEVAGAPLLLILARLGQGLALGGLAHPADAAPGGPRLRRLVLTFVLGAGAAGVILAILAAALTPQDFMAWGWRYPFVMALALNLAAFFGDLRVVSLSAGRGPGRRPALRLVAVAGERFV